MRLKNKLLLTVFFIIPYHTFANSIPIDCAVDTLTNECITLNSIRIDNPYFKPFIVALIEFGLENNIQGQLSKGLLNCYEQICKDKNEFLVQDIRDAFPDLVAGLIKLETKAPRPQIPNQIAGPKQCDLSEIMRLLNDLYKLINQCCISNSVSFSGTFTALFDLQGTLTQCCSNTISEFDSTFTVINAIQNTLTQCCIDFNNAFIGTFTVIDYGINTLFPRLITNLNTVEALLNLNIDITGSIFLQIANCCDQLINSLQDCCTMLINTSTQILSMSNTILGDTNYAQELANYSNCQVNHFFPITTC